MGLIRWRALFFSSLLLLVFLFTLSKIVMAQSGDPEIGEETALATPKACDDVPKYYCTWIRYVQSDATHWQLRKRLYKGGIDGGAQEWQLWFAKDWNWDGSQWVWLATWPMGSWFTNVDFAGSKQNSGNIVTVPYDAVVTMRTRYHEYADHWYYWCGLTTQHNLSVGTSQQYGTGACSDNPR